MLSDMPTRPRTPAQLAGDSAEGLVATRLEALGWTILARNLHIGRHELDIVAIDPARPRALVALEVRWRARRDFGLPEETFDWRKRRRMREAAFGLLDRGRLPTGEPLPLLPLRFDLVLVEPASGRPGEVPAEPRIRHHRNVLGG